MTPVLRLPAPLRLDMRKEVTRYLDCLLQSDTEGALAPGDRLCQGGNPLTMCCSDIVAEAMRRVGELWHLHLISVDMGALLYFRHADGSLPSLYPLIFRTAAKGENRADSTVWAGELHEIGARMIAGFIRIQRLGQYLSGGSHTQWKPCFPPLRNTSRISIALRYNAAASPACRNAVEQLRENSQSPKLPSAAMLYRHKNMEELER